MVDSVPMVLLPPHSSPLFSGVGGPVSPMLARMGLLLSFRERGLVPHHHLAAPSPASPPAEGPFDLSKPVAKNNDADEENDDESRRSDSGDGSSSSGSSAVHTEQPLDLRVVKRKSDGGDNQSGGGGSTVEDENRNLISVLAAAGTNVCRPGSRHSSAPSPAMVLSEETADEAAACAAAAAAAAGRLFPLNYSLVCDSLPLMPPYKYHPASPTPLSSPGHHQRAIYERFEKSLRLPASHHLSLSSALYGAAAAAAAAAQHQNSFAAAAGPVHNPVSSGHTVFGSSGGGGGGGGSGGSSAPPSRDNMPVVQKSLKAILGGGGGSISKPNKERYG
jgi:uncharacterized membrane protein YgcG